MAGYWDGPEGERCPQRTWLTARVGAAAGLLGSAYRIILLRPGSALAALQMAASDTVTMAHSYMTGTVACLGFGTTAALMKIGNKEGWRLTGPPKL